MSGGYVQFYLGEAPVKEEYTFSLPLPKGRLKEDKA